MVDDPPSPSPQSPPSSSRKGRGRPRKRPVDEESASSEEEEVMEPREKLPRVKNVDRSQSKDNCGNIGKCVPDFPSTGHYFRDTFPFDINEMKTPYDYMKLFISDQVVDKIVKETRRYAALQNCTAFQAKVDRDLIRTSQAIMMMSDDDDLTPAKRRMFWEKKEDTGNLLVRKAMSRNTFDDVMRYTHFADGRKPKPDDRFWKVRPLFDAINHAAEKYVEKTEFVSVDESMVKYFGPHPLKQFMRGKPTRFGFKVWVLATSAGELIRCEPYGGSKTKLSNYGLGQGPDVAYGLVEDAKLVAGTKVACDNLFTSLDLLDNMSRKGIGVVGTMRQNRLCKLSLPSKQQGNKMLRGQTEKVYVGEDQVVVVWKDSAPVYIASNFADVDPVGKCSRYSSKEKRKLEVDQPNLVGVYNAHMGGVDLLDGMVTCYAIATRNRKWYWALYNWYLNVSLVQAWRLYRKVGAITAVKEQEKMPLLDFTRSCVEMTVMRHGEVTTSRVQTHPALSASNLAEIKKDNGNHLVIKTPDRKNVCRHCQKRTLYRCRRCDVGLHPDCFEAYHR